MAYNLTLIKFELDEDGRYIEENMKVLDTSFISNETVKELKKIAPMAELTVFEEIGSEEHSKAQCLQNTKIQDVLEFIKNVFIKTLKSSIEVSYEDNNENLIDLISTFRSITNIFHILDVKNSKYKSDDSVIVKIG